MSCKMPIFSLAMAGEEKREFARKSLIMINDFDYLTNCKVVGSWRWLAMGVVRFETVKPWRSRHGAGAGQIAVRRSWGGYFRARSPEILTPPDFLTPGSSYSAPFAKIATESTQQARSHDLCLRARLQAAGRLIIW